MKKIISIVICGLFILSVSLMPTIAINEENKKENIVVSTVEKDLETNIVEEKVYSKDSLGNESVETVNSWLDVKAERLTESETFGVASIISELSDEVNGGIIGTDDRSIVNNTRKFPYSAIVSLQIEFNNGAKKTRGTGFLVADNIVVTAAHVIYNAEYGGFATYVVAKPGRNGELSMPYGLATATLVGVSNQWKDSQDNNYDWGAIKLTHTIVGKPGKIAMSTVEDYSWDIPAKISGYPKYYPGNEITYKQVEASGTVMTVGDYLLGYQIDATHGQSGAPILNENNVAIGIHSFGSGDYNFGARLNSNVLYYLNEFIQEND